jgi:glutathione S-transferase
MPTLYHLPVAICAQKTRVCLAEKGVAWESEDVTGQLRTPDYLKLNPAGYVPTFVHEGKVITESRVISEFIDEAFDGPSLQPRDPYQRSVMRRWTKQIDDSLHPCIFLLSFVPFFREFLLQLPEGEQRKAIPLDQVKAERTLNMLKLGWQSPYIKMGITRFEQLAIDLEACLRQSEWLAGDSYSLADADFTPYLQRMEDLGLDWLWEDKAALSGWYTRVRSRPSFSAVVKDWIKPDEREAAAVKAKEIGPKFQQILKTAA